MGRPPRIAEPGVAYHLLNRRVMRLTIFEEDWRENNVEDGWTTDYTDGTDGGMALTFLSVMSVLSVVESRSCRQDGGRLPGDRWAVRVQVGRGAPPDRGGTGDPLERPSWQQEGQIRV